VAGTRGRVDPSPFEYPGGPAACLLIHGFTGSPAEMRPLGDHLRDRGYRVVAPLLPGHGTRPEDLNQVVWREWASTCDHEFDRMARDCDRLVVAGLSMGALLAIHLAANRPDVSALLAYSPALRTANRFLWLTPLLRHFVHQFAQGSEEETDLTDPEAPARLWHYATYPVGGAAEMLKLQRAVRRELPRVRAPALVVYSTQDHSIAADSGRLTLRLLGSRCKEQLVLRHSGHCLTVDAERERVFGATTQFLRKQGIGS